MKKCVIRPFNVVSALLIIVVFAFWFLIAASIFEAIYDYHAVDITMALIALICISFLVWLTIILLRIVLLPKIVLYDTYLEITSWKNGVPFDKKRPLCFPKPQSTVIKYCDLKLAGAFFAEDIKEYLNNKSGFLYDNWIVAVGVPIPIRLPKVTKKLRDVLLFVCDDGEPLVIDGGQYGLKQVKFLLYKLSELKTICISGRVSPKQYCNSLLLNMVKSILIVVWLTVFPMLTIYIETLFNPLHGFSYQSAFRTLYVLSLYLADFALLGLISIKRQESADQFYRVMAVAKTICCILFALFAVFFAVSIMS